MQTPPYGFFLMNRIKALPEEKSKELSFIPQALIFRQTTGTKVERGIRAIAACHVRIIQPAGSSSSFFLRIDL